MIWGVRTQLPTLLHLYAWTHLSLHSLPSHVLLLMFWTFYLWRIWQQVEQHKLEQAANAQQQQMRDAASAPGVWPPPPASMP